MTTSSRRPDRHASGHETSAFSSQEAGGFAEVRARVGNNALKTVEGEREKGGRGKNGRGGRVENKERCGERRGKKGRGGRVENKERRKEKEGERGRMENKERWEKGGERGRMENKERREKGGERRGEGKDG